MNFRSLSIAACLFIMAVSCKQKQTEEKEDFFPVLSFLKSQVADIDTSLYSIRKYVIIDSLDADTIYVPREKFRDIATDFLTIPDLSEPKYKDRYQEERSEERRVGKECTSRRAHAPVQQI